MFDSRMAVQRGCAAGNYPRGVMQWHCRNKWSCSLCAVSAQNLSEQSIYKKRSELQISAHHIWWAVWDCKPHLLLLWADGGPSFTQSFTILICLCHSAVLVLFKVQPGTFLYNPLMLLYSSKAHSVKTKEQLHVLQMSSYNSGATEM